MKQIRKNKILLLLIVFLPILGCNSKSSLSKSNAKRTTNTVSQNNPYYSRTDTTVLNLTDAEWKKVLTDSVYQVARNKETELAFAGKYWNYTGIGIYYCAACGNALFRSDGKFASECGWPSFFETLRLRAGWSSYVAEHGDGGAHYELVRAAFVLGFFESYLLDEMEPDARSHYDAAYTSAAGRYAVLELLVER